MSGDEARAKKKRAAENVDAQKEIASGFVSVASPNRWSRHRIQLRRIFAEGNLSEAVRGFSLTEMLVVIAIMAILMAVVIPASTSMMGGMNIGSAAGTITDELNFARQTALARNRDVEVRFYKLGSKFDANNKQYRAFRSFLVDDLDSANWKPLSRVKHLSEPIIISDNTEYSSLLPSSPGNGISDGNENLSNGVSAPYVSFRFRANGDTSLRPITKKWFLTIYSEKVKAGAGLPPNYFTVQVDPVTGRTRSYRP